MFKRSKFRERFYLITALFLVGLAALLWFNRPSTQSEQAALAPVVPAATIPAPVLPTMGYGPLAMTTIVAQPPTPTSTISNNATVAKTPLKNISQLSPNNVGVDLSDRFGVIVTGLTDVPDKAASLSRVLSLTGAKWWYQYSQIAPEQPGTQQVYMIRTAREGENSPDYKNWVSFIQNKTNLNNSYWIIGNEPNVPGQDDVPPETYAHTLHSLVGVIRTADPHATFVGPNVLNWDYTCNGCPGYTPGQTWFEQLQTAYQNLYQAPLPFDGYSMHTYSLDWSNLPLLNHTRDVAQIESMRAFLDANPDTRNKPIWLTEFGVIWGYDQLGWEKDAAGNLKAVPKGTLRTDLLTAYFNDTLTWLKANALRLNLARWFIYTSYGLPEPYSTTFSGISLLDGNSPQANLTNYGSIYIGYLKGP
jgi:hypothetical protein